MNLAPRELIIMIASVALGLLFTSPVGLLLHPLTLIDRGIIMAPFLLFGFLLASKRVKTLPIELQLFYRFVLERKPKLDIKSGQKALENPAEVPGAEETSGRRRKKDRGMLVEEENFENPIPISFTGKVKTPIQRKVFLYLDGSLRGEDYVSPTKNSFRVMYVPREEDVGTHDLTVKVEGERDPVVATPVTVMKKNVQLLETRRKKIAPSVR